MTSTIKFVQGLETTYNNIVLFIRSLIVLIVIELSMIIILPKHVQIEALPKITALACFS